MKNNETVQTKMADVQFEKLTDSRVLAELKTEWRKSLTAPEDDMWEAFTTYADHWAIKSKDVQIGYACVNAENCLLQFNLIPLWMPKGVLILNQFLIQEKIKSGIIGTNNPICLSMSMELQQSVSLHTYLFTHMLETEVVHGKGNLNLAQAYHLEALIEFCHVSTGGPKEWLSGYLGNLVANGELFMLEEEGGILGTCEVRKSQNYPGIAYVGMIVSLKHRKMGLGTFLLGKAKEMALSWNLQPNCSCEKGNIGSLKSIQKNGFRSMHQMLLIEF